MEAMEVLPGLNAETEEERRRRLAREAAARYGQAGPHIPTADEMKQFYGANPTTAPYRWDSGTPTGSYRIPQTAPMQMAGPWADLTPGAQVGVYRPGTTGQMAQVGNPGPAPAARTGYDPSLHGILPPRSTPMIHGDPNAPRNPFGTNLLTPPGMPSGGYGAFPGLTGMMNQQTIDQSQVNAFRPQYSIPKSPVPQPSVLPKASGYSMMRPGLTRPAGVAFEVLPGVMAGGPAVSGLRGPMYDNFPATTAVPYTAHASLPPGILPQPQDAEMSQQMFGSYGAGNPATMAADQAAQQSWFPAEPPSRIPAIQADIDAMRRENEKARVGTMHPGGLAYYEAQKANAEILPGLTIPVSATGRTGTMLPVQMQNGEDAQGKYNAANDFTPEGNRQWAAQHSTPQQMWRDDPQLANQMLMDNRMRKAEAEQQQYDNQVASAGSAMQAWKAAHPNQVVTDPAKIRAATGLPLKLSPADARAKIDPLNDPYWAEQYRQKRDSVNAHTARAAFASGWSPMQARAAGLAASGQQIPDELGTMLGMPDKASQAADRQAKTIQAVTMALDAMAMRDKTPMSPEARADILKKTLDNIKTPQQNQSQFPLQIRPQQFDPAAMGILPPSGAQGWSNRVATPGTTPRPSGASAVGAPTAGVPTSAPTPNDVIQRIRSGAPEGDVAAVGDAAGMSPQQIHDIRMKDAPRPPLAGSPDAWTFSSRNAIREGKFNPPQLPNPVTEEDAKEIDAKIASAPDLYTLLRDIHPSYRRYVLNKLANSTDPKRGAAWLNNGLNYRQGVGNYLNPYKFNHLRARDYARSLLGQPAMDDVY